jgi:poly(3-hydroxybutyrate) depolymerase
VSAEAPRVSRRRLLVGGAVATVGAAASLGATGHLPLPRQIRARLNDPHGTIPAATVGDVALDRVQSAARGREVGLFTAVPPGLGEGSGLPVCLVLHGASATTADFRRFGLPEFLTDAVDRGAPPFALVGVDGGPTRWEGDGAGDDPQAMLRDEVPGWCEERGFDHTRIAAHGWSMGGYGSLLAAALDPGWLRAVAVLSPAVGGGRLEPLIDRLEGDRIALWCGKDDGLYDSVRDFAAAITGGPAIAAYDDGGHTRGYWNTVTTAALTFVGESLGDPGRE